MTAARLVTLTGLRLPADAPVLRDHVRPEAARDAEYHDRYDRRTVFYDAVRTGTGDRVVLTAPPFWNLWPMVRAGLRRDGKPLRRVTRQRHEKSEQLVLSLPRDQRAAVVLYYYEDLPVADIASLLRVPAGTVKSRLSRARDKLRLALSDPQVTRKEERT